jgi:hypothetical protein
MPDLLHPRPHRLTNSTISLRRHPSFAYGQTYGQSPRYRMVTRTQWTSWMRLPASGNFEDDNNGAGAPNNSAQADILNLPMMLLQGCLVSALLVTRHYHKTELLKVHSDVNPSHYLYKKIIERGRAAQRDNYDFNPWCLLQNTHGSFLENWLQCQNSCPQQIATTLSGPVEHGCPEHGVSRLRQLV